jgi:O-antigen/teichoic acid export membrane protein
VPDPAEEAHHTDSFDRLTPPVNPAEGSDTDDVRKLDLSGSGRHFVWNILPTVVSTLTSMFLLAFSVRRLGAAAYGGVVTIGSSIAILTLFTGAIRYAVVRAGARFSDRANDGSSSPTTNEMEAVRAAHALFVGAAVATFGVAAALGWLLPLDLHMHGAMARQVYLAALIFVAASCLGIATTAYSGVLTGNEQFRALAQIGLVTLAVQVVGTLLLVGRLHIIGLALAALASAFVQSVSTYVISRRRVPWLHILPHPPRRSATASVLRYAIGLAILSATSTICTSSDAFIIGAVSGSAAVTVFRIGAAAPTTLASLLYSSFGVLFPRLARSTNPSQQEEAVGWTGKMVGWLTGSAFSGLCLLGADLVDVLLGHSDWQATQVVWICSAALAVDVSYHGVVQVIFARGQQGMMAKYSWIELSVNLAATYVFVRLYGPVGSAWALAGTIVVTDLIGFPIIMRRRWGSPAGRFVVKHGLAQSVMSGALVAGVGVVPLLMTRGILLHIAIVSVAELVTLGIGILLVGSPGRVRLLTLAWRSTR